jgi:hypothetical protein
MTNRITGPTSPEPSRSKGLQAPDAEKFKKKLDAVEKVGEVDLDQPRKQRFSTVPDETSTELPQSTDFWEEFQMPDEPLAPIQFQETPSSQLNAPYDQDNTKPPPSTTPTSRTEQQAKDKKKKTELHGLPGNPVEKDPKKNIPTPKPQYAGSWKEHPLKQEEKKTAKQAPSQKEPSQAPPHPFAASSTQKKEKNQSETSGPVQPVLANPKPHSPMKQAEHLWTEEEESIPFPKIHEKSKKESSDTKQLTTPPSPIHPPDPLPAPIQQIAQTTQTQAAPYLNTQIAALFRQMVGTIIFMGSTTPGITRTEVILNQLAFQKSVFYNSTITIEKYATAPDSFNIRLTGSDTAVKMFNDNIPNLMSSFANAYEQKNIKFRIGRLETSYSTERPLIRRKKEAGDKDTGGDLPQR